MREAETRKETVRQMANAKPFFLPFTHVIVSGVAWHVAMTFLGALAEKHDFLPSSVTDETNSFAEEMKCRPE